MKTTILVTGNLNARFSLGPALYGTSQSTYRQADETHSHKLKGKKQNLVTTRSGEVSRSEKLNLLSLARVHLIGQNQLLLPCSCCGKDSLPKLLKIIVKAFLGGGRKAESSFLF